MQRALWHHIFIWLLTSLGCAVAAADDAAYATSIRKVQGENAKPAQGELARCLTKQFKRHDVERRRFRAVFENAAPADSYLVLETVSSYWLNYWFAYVWIDADGGHIHSNVISHNQDLRFTLTVSKQSVTELFSKIAAERQNIPSSGNQFVSDGTCYFMTVKLQDRKEAFATFGLPSSNANQAESAPAERVVETVWQFLKQNGKQL